MSLVLYILNFRWIMEYFSRCFIGSWVFGFEDWVKVYLREIDWRVIYIEVDVFVEFLRWGYLGNGLECKEG